MKAHEPQGHRRRHEEETPPTAKPTRAPVDEAEAAAVAAAARTRCRSRRRIRRADEAPAPATPEMLRFTVRNEVLHGPVLGLSGFGIARVNTHLVLSDEDPQGRSTRSSARRIRSRSARASDSWAVAPPRFTSEGRTIKPKDGKAEITWETFKLAIGYSKDADKYDIDGKWPKFEVNEPRRQDAIRHDGHDDRRRWQARSRRSVRRRLQLRDRQAQHRRQATASTSKSTTCTTSWTAMTKDDFTGV